MSNKPLILVVDDESKIRKLLKVNLELEGYDTIGAANGKEALDIITKSSTVPDLILLDLMMPMVDGMTFLKKLRSLTASTPVIILSAKDETPTVIEGFREGADDFVPKPFFIKELMERVKVALSRSNSQTAGNLADNYLRNGALAINFAHRQCLVNDTEVKLTDTEFRLLHELMRHPGEVLPHERLLRSVWGEEFIGEVQYLRVTLARIKKSLNRQGLTDQ